MPKTLALAKEGRRGRKGRKKGGRRGEEGRGAEGHIPPTTSGHVWLIDPQNY